MTWSRGSNLATTTEQQLHGDSVPWLSGCLAVHSVSPWSSAADQQHHSGLSRAVAGEWM